MESPSSATLTSVDVEEQRDALRKRLTVTFCNLSVRVTAPDAALGSTMWSEVDPRQLLDLFQRKKRPMRVSITENIYVHGKGT